LEGLKEKLLSQHNEAVWDKIQNLVYDWSEAEEMLETIHP